ncbi:MAG: hypothetical protein AAFN70_12700, partial [Planctomycetota bacterium]
LRSVNPGSPRFFVPGYGYMISGPGPVGYSALGSPFHSSAMKGFSGLPGYSRQFQFGMRYRTLGTYNAYRTWHQPGGLPWYFPGWSDLGTRPILAAQWANNR